MKDKNGNVMVSSEAVLERRKEYFEKLMNEENDREPRTTKAELVNEEANCVSREKVENPLRRMKSLRQGSDRRVVVLYKKIKKFG